MSERMIELQRARMGLPPSIKQPPSTSAIPASGSYCIGGSGFLPMGNCAGISHNALSLSSVSPYSSALAAQPQASTAATLLSENERMQRFLHLLADSHSATPDNNDGGNQRISATLSSSDATNTCSFFRGAPTVPCSLSRRILHRQGAGYLDETVAVIASGAADRFLATVLQQAVACRDRRLRGEELANRERQELTRHCKRRNAQTRARIRKRKRIENLREARNLDLTAAGEAVLTSTTRIASASDATNSVATGSGIKINSKTKAKTAVPDLPNGILPDKDGKTSENGGRKISIEGGGAILEDDESLDAEEEYYKNFYGDESVEKESDASDSSGVDDNSKNNCLFKEDEESEEDESQYVLLMRDLARPLESWGISLTGKIGLGVVPAMSLPPAPANVMENVDDESDEDAVAVSERDIDDEVVEEAMEGDDSDSSGKGEKNDIFDLKTSPTTTPLRDGVNEKNIPEKKVACSC